MRFLAVAPMALAAVSIGAAALAPARAADSGTRISGPHVHDNLAVYFVHGPSAPGPVPVTLGEALAKGSVRVIETGNVNALQVENLGAEEVFIQSGDIVKGGQQDRVLTVSLLLPAKSGKVAIDSFCVEQGRWAPRGKEDVKTFASSSDYLPSREAKLAMKAPPKELAVAAAVEQRPAGLNAGVTGSAAVQQRIARGAENDTSIKQRKVWEEVASIQSGLERRLGAKVAAPQSATSLQLSLENEQLKAARAAYIAALESKTAGQGDIVGFVFAIDGRINSADVYPSNALFQKMWGKLLAASVTEAIGAKGKAGAASGTAPPALAEVDGFIKSAETGKSHKATIAKLMTTETRDADKSLYVEARREGGAWVHRNYLAK